MDLMHRLQRYLGLDFLFYRGFRFLSAPLRQAPPVGCALASDTEIHSLVSHRHLEIYLLALRSFLRFYERVKVVAHDDGTLSRRDQEYLSQKIRNIRVIPRWEADRSMEETLRGYPHCRKFRNKQILTAQVFDFPAFAASKKIISLDSDILVFRYPQEVVGWIEGETGEILYAYEEKPRSPRIRKKNITASVKTPFQFAPNLCGGFVCCYADMFDLDLIERYCSYVIRNCHDRLYRAQTITALCAQNSLYSPRPLPWTYQNLPHFKADPEPVLRHYFISLSHAEPYVRDAGRVLKEMQTSEALTESRLERSVVTRNSKKKIVQISLGPGYSGSAKFAILSTLGFRDLGHEVCFIAAERSLTAGRAREAGLDLRTLPVDKAAGYDALKEILDRLRPEFVIAHDSRERKYLMRLRREQGRKFYAIAFRSIAAGSFPFLSSIPYNLWLDLNVACSRGVVRSLLVRGILPSKIRVVYNGIEPFQTRPDPIVKESLGIPREAKLIGISSWLHKKRKGFDILFSAVGRGLPFPFRVLMLGIHPDLRSRATAMARSFGLDEESLIYPGYVEDVWPYYAAMDVYVLPSRKEGFSLSLLEGMVCGLPVIVSDIPGNNEAVTHGVNGLLFPIRKPEKLRKALIEVLTQPDRARELGRAARKTVLENFTVEKISVQFDRVLEELRTRRTLDLPGR